MIYDDITGLRNALAAGCPDRRNLGAPREIADKLLSRLKALKPHCVEALAGLSNYSEGDIADLWSAWERFASELPSLVVRDCRAPNKVCSHRNDLWKSELRMEPWGIVLVCIPSNAVVPLSMILPLALAAGGNRVVLAYSGKVRNLGLSIFEEVSTVLGDRVLAWSGAIRDVVAGLVSDDRRVDLLYYMGGSGQYSAIAELCARSGVALHYEGEGRTIALLGSELTPSEIEKAARQILNSKVFCNGEMCSSPNSVLVPASIYKAFIDSYRYLCESVGQPVSYNGERLRSLRRTHGKEQPYAEDQNRPGFWAVDLSTALAAEELFCPGVLVSAVHDVRDCIAQLAGASYRLQITVFGKESFLESVISQTGYARYCWWMSPADQDPCLPWGNYGCSGYSNVADFYQKGLRRVIVEGPQCNCR